MNGLLDQKKLVDSNKSSWQGYFNTLKDGEQWQEKFVQQNDLSKVSLTDVANAQNAAKQSAIAYNNRLKQLTIGAKAANVALKGLALAGNILLSIAISKIVDVAITSLDNYIHRVEKTKERVYEMISTFESAIDTAEAHKKSIEDISSRYEELSKGVDSLGRNVSLTTSEYGEYNDICNQIADMFPTLLQGYTNEGNAIIKLKGHVEDLTQAYEDEKIAAYEALIASGENSDGKDIIDNWNNNIDEDRGKGTNTLQALNQLRAFVQSDMNATVYNELREKASVGIYDGMTDAERLIAGSEFLPYKFDFGDVVTDEDLANAKKQAKLLYQTYNSELESDFSSVKSLANAYLMTNEDYKKLDDESKSIASILINSIPADSNIAQVLFTKSKEDIGLYIAQIVSMIGDNKDVANALSELFSLDLSDLSPDEAKSEIDKYIELIAGYLHEDENELKIRLGFDTADSLAEYYNNTINRFKTDEESKLEELKQSYQEAIDKRKELYSGTNYVGNVDINNRPVVINGDGSYSTTSTSFQEKWIGDEENGHYIIAHFTPILPDGTVLDDDSLNEYIDKILNSADPMEADKVENGGKGIVYKIDTQINGKDITDDNLEDAFGIADAWDVDMHNLQDKMYKDEAAIKAQIARFDDGVYGSQKIKDFFDTEGINTQEEIDAFNEVTKEINDADKAIRAWIEHKLEANESDLSFTDAISQVQLLSEGFDQLDSIYADVLNKEDFDWSSILNNESFKNAFEECGDAYTDFIETISNSPDDINKCQDAFNDLATAYVNNSGILDNLTEENKKATTTMLEQMGVSNAEEVVTSALTYRQKELAAQKVVLANTTKTLENITSGEIDQLENEGIVSQETSQELLLFALQKQTANLTDIDTTVDIGNLSALCTALAATGVECTKLKQLIDLLNDGSIMPEERRQTIINRIQKEMEEIMSDKGLKITLPTVDYTGADKTKSTLDSTKKSADDLYNDLKEQIDAYMDFMEKSLDAGKIDYNGYCSSVKGYLDNLYNSGKLKAADYFDYIEQMLNKQKAIYDKVISAVTDRLDEEIDKWQEKIDSLEDTNDKLNDNLSNMDSALDAIDKVYDDEIDRIQAIIDGLKNANDERSRTLALEKARYELEKAYNNRIVKQYVEGRGYIYTADFEAIRDKQSAFDDAELDLKTAELQKQIDELEKFKAQWDSVKGTYQDNIDAMNATALLGSEYQKLILNNNILDIENFKNQYVGIQQQINSNEELIKSYQEKINYYNKLKDQWSALSDEYEKQQNRMYAAEVLGADWESQILLGRESTLINFKNSYISLEQAILDAQVQAANAQKETLQGLIDAEWTATKSILEAKQKRATNDSPSDIPSDTTNVVTNEQVKAVKDSWNANLDKMPTSVSNTITGNNKSPTYTTADALKKAQEEYNKNKEKETHTSSSNVTHGGGGVRRYASGGVVKLNPDDLLSDIAHKNGEDGFIMAKNGERVLTERQNTSFETLVDMLTKGNYTPNMFTPDFTKTARLINNDNSSVMVNIGDINLHDVQNPDQLADAIIKYMPGTTKQKLSKSGR